MTQATEGHAFQYCTTWAFTAQQCRIARITSPPQVSAVQPGAFTGANLPYLRAHRCDGHTCVSSPSRDGSPDERAAVYYFFPLTGSA